MERRWKCERDASKSLGVKKTIQTGGLGKTQVSKRKKRSNYVNVQLQINRKVNSQERGQASTLRITPTPKVSSSESIKGVSLRSTTTVVCKKRVGETSQE